MLRNKNKYNIPFIIGLLFIIIGLGALFYNYFNQKKIEAFSKMNISLLETEMPNEINNDANIPEVEGQPLPELEDTNEPEDTEEVPEVIEKPKPIDYSKYYVGTLEIPKINLKKGFLDINSPYNNVNRNVTVIKSSSYPDVDKGNFILASHTGSSSVSFFTKLHKLVLGDQAFINYKGKKYTYELVDIYLQQKVGTISIYRNTEKTTLTLVTCTPNTKDKQTVFILELISVE